MVNSKKLLSLFLAVVMVLSVFTVMASAYTRVETEGTADIDVKYTVEKVDTVPETEAGSAEWSADNIYAVTVWMKSAKPVDTFTVPFHYNKAHFAPITLSDGECTYPYGAGMDQDTYYTDMGEGAIYAYSLGDYMNNTGMYKANGTTATTKALAKCIGLGNANSTGVAVISELVSPDHTLYNKWGAGLPADTGVVYANLDVACNAKTAYFNTLEGIATYTDWVNMFTLYFETITEDDVTGDEFGVFTDDCFTVDGNYDANGLGYYESAANYDAQRPTMNIVSNAVVEESVPACDHSADKLTWTTVTASTCKTAGTEKGVCSCGEYETTRALPLDANNHEGPKSWTTVTAPTYTTAGSEKEVCTACTKDTGNTRPLAIKEFVTGLKGQIRFHKNENGAYAGSFDVRALATIPAAKFEEVFTADKATQKSMIKEVGFVFAQGAAVTAPSMDAVKGLVENGTEAAGYTKKTVEYISTSLVKDSYTFSCIVTDIPDAQKTNSLVAVGYIAWDSNNDGKVDSYAYYPTAQTISFETLYNTYYNTAFPQA